MILQFPSSEREPVLFEESNMPTASIFLPDDAPVSPPVRPVIRELPLLGALRGPDMIRDDVLRTFGDEEESAVQFAIRWAWDRRRIQGMTQSKACQYLGIPESHLSNILNGRKYLPPQKINAYEWIVGNRAVSLTIERFRKIREEQMVSGISKMVAEHLVRGAA